MNWFYFHFFTSLAAVFVAYGWVKRPGRPQHIIGAQAIFWSCVASEAVRLFSGAIDPAMLYLLIDVAAIGILGYVMMTRKAIWAALCVIFHFGMIVASAAYYMGEALSQYAYLTTLGVLFFLSVVSVTTGALASRYSWGEHLDRLLAHRFGPWSWSGVGVSRDPYYQTAGK